MLIESMNGVLVETTIKIPIANQQSLDSGANLHFQPSSKMFHLIVGMREPCLELAGRLKENCLTLCDFHILYQTLFEAV